MKTRSSLDKITYPCGRLPVRHLLLLYISSHLQVSHSPHESASILTRPLVGDALYIDGGLGGNNPTAICLEEVKALWGPDKIECIVSVGTGKFSPGMNLAYATTMYVSALRNTHLSAEGKGKEKLAEDQPEKGQVRIPFLPSLHSLISTQELSRRGRKCSSRGLASPWNLEGVVGFGNDQSSDT